MMKIIIIATGLYFHSPAIFFKNIFADLNPAAAFHMNADRVFKKCIVADITVGNIF